MVDADVAIAEVDPAVVAAPAIGVDDGARVDPAADDALVRREPRLRTAFRLAHVCRRHPHGEGGSHRHDWLTLRAG